ncbi:hypothetical protein [Acrocarpospora catenulata]|uniref:hypothetical protein n=1 Tax=Acrocarpospora catenulata TaxID=2836182 RepID=UPI0027E08EB2|nr:hypothetical protein [Acrocarpospora catenulata]
MLTRALTWLALTTMLGLFFPGTTNATTATSGFLASTLNSTAASGLPDTLKTITPAGLHGTSNAATATGEVLPGASSTAAAISKVPPGTLNTTATVREVLNTGKATAPARKATISTGRVVLIGVPGLQWSDLNPETTPNLWALTGRSAAASLSIRTIPPPGRSTTCPLNGWLTISAGQRAGSPGDCAPPPTPVVAADGSATIPTWSALRAYQQSGSFKADIGLLAQTILDNGGKVAAVGPGAALAAATKSGNVARYVTTSADLPDFSPYNLITVEADELQTAWMDAQTGTATMPPSDADVGTPTDLAPEVRREAAAAVDRTVGEILGRVPVGSTLLLAGVSDASEVAHLHVAMAQGPGYRPGLMTAASTRQDALVTITDVTATVLGTLGMRVPEGVVGRAWVSDGTASGGKGGADARTPNTGTPNAGNSNAGNSNAGTSNAENSSAGNLNAENPNTGNTNTGNTNAGNPDAEVTDVGDVVARLADADLASQVLREVREPFFLSLVAVQLVFYGLAALVVRRNGLDGTRRTMSATRVVAVVSGAIPISTFLAQLVPWWSVGHPMPALIATILGFAGLITVIALAGPWRRSVMGPLTVVAGVSSVALLIDVMTGSHLQVNAVTGYEPVTGGRFYGFGNMAFAVYSTGTILALAGLAHALRNRVGTALCLGYGLLAIFADGWPGWGADFGGVPSFVLGFAVFMLMLVGRRVTIGKLVAVGAAGTLLIGALAVADRLRPPEQRTHLGVFVQQVLDGEAGSVLGRKLGAMLGTLGNLPLTLLSLVALAFLYLVLARPSHLGAPALSRAYGYAPTLRAGLFGALTAALVGFLINDSGIAIPAMALTVAVPLTLAASLHALRLARSTTAAPQSAPAGSRARPGP